VLVSTDRLLRDLLQALDKHLGDAVSLRHALHANPELGNAEHETARRVMTELEDSVHVESVLNTGVIARVGPTGVDGVGLRAELDGLPLAEATGASYAATNGKMHACGHDVHMAALVAVCRAAADVDLPRPLIGVFQPSEERYPSGAQQLVDARTLDRHQLGAMLAVHLHPQPPKGTVAIGTGTINASSDEFELVIEGAGGHGAYPHLTRDPVLALSHVIVALQHVVARRVDPLHSAVIGIGTISADGAANIVPSEARARGTLRCLQLSDRAELRTVITEVAQHTAHAYGCQVRTTFVEGEPAVVNSPALLSQIEQVLPSVSLRPGAPMRSCGADDFGFYTEELPSVMLFLGIHDDPEQPGLHHPRFLPPDDMVMATARALIAGYVGSCAFIDEVTDEREGSAR
jgi:amidohydrolase